MTQTEIESIKSIKNRWFRYCIKYEFTENAFQFEFSVIGLPEAVFNIIQYIFFCIIDVNTFNQFTVFGFIYLFILVYK